MDTSPDDRIFPITRIIAAVVVPFLLLAFLILFFFPGDSGQRFAWEIRPQYDSRLHGRRVSWGFLALHQRHYGKSSLPPTLAIC